MEDIILLITFVLCCSFVIIFTYLINKLNKGLEIYINLKESNITIKDLFNYYKKRILETKEEKIKRYLNSMH